MSHPAPNNCYCRDGIQCHPCLTRAAVLVASMRDERRKNDPAEIVAEFEHLFGPLTATERTWLTGRIKESNTYARRR